MKYVPCKINAIFSLNMYIYFEIPFFAPEVVTQSKQLHDPVFWVATHHLRNTALGDLIPKHSLGVLFLQFLV